MSHLIKRAVEVFRTEGPIELFKRALRHVHRRLPDGKTKYNGVYVKSCLLFDPFLPWRETERPNYESGLLEGIRNHVEEGDTVVIVGGGWGVTATKAAEQVGNNGSVTVFEGSSEGVDRTRRTAKLNGVSDIVDVRHAVVGPAVDVWGGEEEASQVRPEDLPECDVLELDCEGAEIDILNNMTITPEVVLVESHGVFDAPTEEVKEVLEKKSYSVVSEEVADLDLKDACVEKDIYAITSLLNPD